MASSFPCETDGANAARCEGSSGFTLLELSVLMVVIGLIAGGVLVGRDLIHAAEIRSAIRQIENFNTAVNAFRSKYGCLPGDCAAAADFGFAVNSSGNGDGYISETHEYTNFWYHLSAAGLIPFSLQDFDYYCAIPCGGGTALAVATWAGYASPSATIRSPAPHPKPPAPGLPAFLPTTGGWIVQGRVEFDAIAGSGSFQEHSFVLASPYTDGQLGGPFGNILVGFSPSTTFAIDGKIDDGLPLSGNTRAASGRQSAGTGPYSLNNNLRSAAGRPASVPASAYCVDDTGSPAEYHRKYPGNGVASYPLAWRAAGNCSLVIKATF